MNFQEQKQKQLSKADKSSIGDWDEKIKNLCNKLNKNKNYYTTSSCAGRIVLIKSLDGKAKDVFLFRTHKKISFNELKKAIKKAGENYKELIDFQQTPCILHVACKDLNSAHDLVNKAKLVGWKHSGIMSLKRFMVELHSTEKLEFPIIENRKLLVNDDFLRLIIKQASKRLEKTWKKIKNLEKII